MTAQGDARARFQKEDEIVAVLQWVQYDVALLVTGDQLMDGSHVVAGGRTLRFAEGDPLIGADEPVPVVARTRLHHHLAGDVEKQGGAGAGDVVDQVVEQGLEGQPGRLTWGSSSSAPSHAGPQVPWGRDAPPPPAGCAPRRSGPSCSTPGRGP